MHNIEYLTEKDLKYFEKKEALGEAIIIRIEPETLLSLDLDELFKERDKDQTLSAEELEAFLKGRPAVDSEPGHPEEEADGPLTGLERNLQRAHLSEEQKQRFIQAVNSGATDDELMDILKDGGK